MGTEWHKDVRLQGKGGGIRGMASRRKAAGQWGGIRGMLKVPREVSLYPQKGVPYDFCDDMHLAF